MDELAGLRDELAETDRELLGLIARRQRLATRIGAIKRRQGLPPHDWRQERTVVLRARDTAEALDLDPGVAERVLLLLTRAALALQERDRVSAGAGGSGKRSLVIGGAGRMGRWFVRFLDAQGYAVQVADPAGPVEGFPHVADWTALAVDHDLVVVAAPLAETNRALLELARRRPPGLVVDIGSLKSPLREGLDALAAAGVRAASLHPMFGPDTELLTGRHVIFCDLGHPEALHEARELFSVTAAAPVTMDRDAHDRLIASVLGLSHAVNIAFFTALADSGEAAPRLADISSTTFDEQLRVAVRVASESPRLYFEIQALNEHGLATLAALERAVGRLREIVAAGDEEAFAELMRQGRDYLGRRRPPAPGVG